MLPAPVPGSTSVSLERLMQLESGLDKGRRRTIPALSGMSESLLDREIAAVQRVLEISGQENIVYARVR